MRELRSIAHGVLRGLILAGFAIAMLGGASLSSTLCIGQDGHVAFEPAADRHCGDAAAPATEKPQAASLLATPSCCGPCTDLATTQRVTSGSAESKAPRPALAALPPLRDARASRALVSIDRGKHSPAEPRLPAALAGHRSILRC